MDAFAPANGKMKLAVGADFEVLVEFLVENHGRAFAALRPKAFRDLPLARLAGQLWLFGKGRFGTRGGRWRDRRLNGLSARNLFRHRRSGHITAYCANRCS